MEHCHDPVDLLQFLPGNIQPEVERLGELRSDFFAGGGRDVGVGFKEDLERLSSIKHVWELWLSPTVSFLADHGEEEEPVRFVMISS